MDRSAQRPRIADVARAAGVSKTAVSFAFNSPDRLSAETTERIRQVALQLGYRPNPVARMLTQRQTMTIGVLTPQALSVIFGNPFFGVFSEGVALAAEEYGYGLSFISPLHGSLVNALGRATVDGVVAIGLPASHPEVEQIRRAGVPLVLVDSVALPEHPSIDVDDVGGARAAAAHLATLGHRDILVLAIEPPTREPDADGVTPRRLRGYREALRGVGVEIPAEHVLIGPATVEGGFAATRRALDTGLRPTAILAMADAMAIGAMKAVRESGFRIPLDMSVVGFDDTYLAVHVEPPLTTVHQPIRRKGEEAVHALLGVMQSGEQEGPVHRRLRTRLVVRASTGPPPDLP